MLARLRQSSVPIRALAISVASLIVPAVSAYWFPDWTSNGVGMLIWLTALIPAFLLSYYRGLVGVAVALAGGMAVITATQLSVVIFDIASPNWSLLAAIVAVYLFISIGIGILSEALRRERRAAEELALVDKLTGLPNRRHLEVLLDTEFAAAERGHPLSVIMFDLDNFKSVNDRFGHPSGDMTLTQFAKILKLNTRKENLSARYGGEEFVTVLRDTDSESAAYFAQRVLDQLRAKPFPWGMQTVSAGIASHQKGLGSFEFMLAAADRALYQAKQGGRDMVCVAPPFETAGGVPAADARPPVRISAALERFYEATIYVVDDDDAVRSVLKRVLQKSGFQLWDTGDPREAITHFRNAAPDARPALILTDVLMPEMTGMTMIDQIAAMDPDVRVIYMSGFVQSEISWTGTPGAVIAFLAKPIENDLLIATVTDVLQREAAAR